MSPRDDGKTEGARGAAPARTSHDTLAAEVQAWEDGTLSPRGWDDAPSAVPRAGESKSVSIRFPTRMLDVLRAFAEREGIGYQVLIKRWLDDRIRAEAEALRTAAGPVRTRRPGHRRRRDRIGPDAVLEDVADDSGPRRRRVG